MESNGATSTPPELNGWNPIVVDWWNIGEKIFMLIPKSDTGVEVIGKPSWLLVLDPSGKGAIIDEVEAQYDSSGRVKKKESFHSLKLGDYSAKLFWIYGKLAPEIQWRFGKNGSRLRLDQKDAPVPSEHEIEIIE